MKLAFMVVQLKMPSAFCFVHSLMMLKMASLRSLGAVLVEAYFVTFLAMDFSLVLLWQAILIMLWRLEYLSCCQALRSGSGCGFWVVGNE